MKNKKYILFDLDGTLTNSAPGITNCVKYALEKTGHPIPPYSVLKKFIGPPLLDGFMEYACLTEEDARDAVSAYRERYRDIGIFENEVYEGIPELLESLNAVGKTVILATCKPKVFADRILRHFGLDSYFLFTVGAELDGRFSYKNEVISEVIRRGNIQNKSEMVMIGDRHHDIDGAKQTCIQSIGVSYGFAEKGELEKAGADAIADSPLAIKNMLI